MEGGTSCIQLSLLPEGANTFTNGLRCFKVIVMVAFASAELSLLSCIILVLCFLFPPAGFILVYWELSGTGRLLHKRSKLYLVPVPVLFHSISWHCILVYGRDFLGPSFNELRKNSCSPKFRTAVPYLLDLKRFGLILRGNMICFLHVFFPLCDIYSVRDTASDSFSVPLFGSIKSTDNTRWCQKNK